MRPPRNVLVVGAGLAGSRVAETLRAEGYGGRLVLVGDEPVPPYERPALSKELLAGTREPAALTLRDEAAYEDRGIELALGRRVVRLDRRSALLDDGTRLPWDAVVLATGARARSLPGRAPSGVHRLRTLADALALRAKLLPGRRLVVIGAGLVGSEVAWTASRLGVDVVLADRELPLQGALGADVGSLLASRQCEHGIDLHLGAGAIGFRASAGGRVEAVVLEDGTTLACDVALVAIGVEPAADLLDRPGRAIPTDACGRTAVPGVYAAGDAALPYNPWLGRPAATDHWTAAAATAAATARAILGHELPYSEPPSFWSDQLGLRLQFVGSPGPWARIELEGDGDSFQASYYDAGGMRVAGLAANRPTEFAHLRRELSIARLPVAA
jgi:3-phenylpropionate/trans-cinnamate dioxygenase ferredoxin reductase component